MKPSEWWLVSLVVASLVLWLLDRAREAREERLLMAEDDLWRECGPEAARRRLAEEQARCRLSVRAEHDPGDEDRSAP